MNGTYTRTCETDQGNLESNKYTYYFSDYHEAPDDRRRGCFIQTLLTVLLYGV